MLRYGAHQTRGSSTRGDYLTYRPTLGSPTLPWTHYHSQPLQRFKVHFKVLLGQCESKGVFFCFYRCMWVFVKCRLFFFNDPILLTLYKDDPFSNKKKIHHWASTPPWEESVPKGWHSPVDVHSLSSSWAGQAGYLPFFLVIDLDVFYFVDFFSLIILTFTSISFLFFWWLLQDLVFLNHKGGFQGESDRAVTFYLGHFGNLGEKNKKLMHHLSQMHCKLLPCYTYNLIRQFLDVHLVHS